MSMKYIRHYSKCYKSELKNVQAAGSKSEKLKSSTDQDAICKILYKAQ